MTGDFLDALLVPGRWATFVLLTARIGGLLSTAPLWSMTAIPRTLRGAFTVVLAAMLAVTRPPGAVASEGFDLVLPLVGELAVGAAIGLSAAVVVHGAMLGGEVIALQMGLSLGPALAPSPELEVSGVAQMVSLFALATFVMLGGPNELLRALAASLDAVPPGLALAPGPGIDGVAALFGTVLSSGVRVAAPVMGALLLVHLALALVGRAVPQMNTLLTAFPITIAAGLVAVGLAAPLIGRALAGAFASFPAMASRVLDGFVLAGGR